MWSYCTAWGTRSNLLGKNVVEDSMRKRIYMYMYVCVCIYIYMYVCVYIYVCMCVCVYIYVYIWLGDYAVQQKLTQHSISAIL